MVRRVASSIFVGRVDERAHLEAALEGAGRGEAGLVLVGGEAGIGKSRLVAELAATARDVGARVAGGRCFETTAVALPFAPWIEILREILLRDPGAAGSVASGVAGAELARLVPEIAGPGGGVEESSSDDGRTQLFHAVLDLLRRVGARQPLVLLLEDLHWADASSLDLLRFVVGQLASERLLLVATFRDDASEGPHGLQPTLAELSRLPHVLRVDLRPFDRREVAEQLTGIGGRRPAVEVVDRIFARSDGNPFVVEELAGQRPDGDLPPTLRDVLAARLATLSPQTRRVIAAAAAIGRDVEDALLRRVAAIPDEEVSQALHEAVARHVLVRASTTSSDLSFRHALIQEFAYGELLPAGRTQLHAAITRALTDRGDPPGEISRHALLAGDLPHAFACAVEAADRAAAALAFAEALAQVQQALALWDEVEDPAARANRDRPALLLLGARCAVATGDWSRAVDLRRAALGELGPVRRAERVAVLLDLADALSYSADWPGVTRTIREAAELVPSDPPTPARARVLAELANSEVDEGRLDTARELAEEAIGVARAAHAPREEVRALLALALIAMIRLHFGTAAQILEAAHRVVAEGPVTDEYVVATAVARRTEVSNMVGDFERAMEQVEAGLARAARAGTLAQQRPFLRWRQITACVALGRWDEAEAFVEEAEHDTTPMQYKWSVHPFLPALLRQGRLSDAAEALRRTDHGYDTPWEGSGILQARLRVAAAAGRWAEARAAADEAIGLFPVDGEGFLVETLPDAIGAEADWAEAAKDRRRTAEEAEARTVGLDRLDRLRRILRSAIEEGGAGALMELTLATAEAEGSRLLGRSDPALWKETAARAAALHQPWEAAYARFRQAESMLEHGVDRQDALRLLREAHRATTELGARPLREKVEGLARRGRLRLEPGTKRGTTRQARNDEGVVVTITNREWEVLSMVAAGHTNKEIGEALFISEKTASVHITNAMDKLGALSRYDAAASAARLGLLDSGGSDDAAGTDAGRHRGLGTGRSSRPGGGPRS